NVDGAANTAVGSGALAANVSGGFNSAFGIGALSTNVAGVGNTAVGDLAGLTVTGDFNTCIGGGAGAFLARGSLYNDIGTGTNGLATDVQVIRIGGGVRGTPALYPPPTPALFSHRR